MIWRLIPILLLATHAWACSCAPNWPSAKQAWEKMPGIFLGTVELADPDEDARQAMFKEQFVRIHVDHAFKGVLAGQTVELHQAGTDCSAKFRTGDRAVFYLSKGTSPGTWVVPWCTRSLGSAEPNRDDLLFLEGLPRSAVGTRLSGEIELYEDSPTEAFRRVGGIPNVRLKIAGPKGFAKELTTNSAGAYEVFGLRPGTYSVTLDVPEGLKIDFPVLAGSPGVPGNEAAVKLASNGGASVGFVLKADTRLSGRMLDANGAPVANVCIDLEPIGGVADNGARFFDCSNEDGRFEMHMMPPGKYRLIARDDIKGAPLKSTSTLYYPGVRDRERATTVSIEAGNYVENTDIRLPSNEQRYRIAGRVQFADGAPAASARVTFTSPQHGYSETTETDLNGSFTVPVIAGMEGQLAARLSIFDPILKLCPDLRVGPNPRGLFHFIDATPVTVLSDTDRSGVKLELLSPSCKSLSPGSPKDLK